MKKLVKHTSNQEVDFISLLEHFYVKLGRIFFLNLMIVMTCFCLLTVKFNFVNLNSSIAITTFIQTIFDRIKICGFNSLFSGILKLIIFLEKTVLFVE